MLDTPTLERRLDALVDRLTARCEASIELQRATLLYMYCLEAVIDRSPMLNDSERHSKAYESANAIWKKAHLDDLPYQHVANDCEDKLIFIAARFVDPALPEAEVYDYSLDSLKRLNAIVENDNNDSI